ncbi:efflux transporter, RND family, MFP subunit [Luminiphilus syltensis NOR5-1B]|uniref:Efflux transporter, RND family, MFP subunit n=2 Tax=Luminiphilus TaxID=1341118 RepID=B8KX84_9GAMM|nr:efflux transporter, RND family, MFP subunit [Luminiphilus syltensis NOR5-1B]
MASGVPSGSDDTNTILEPAEQEDSLFSVAVVARGAEQIERVFSAQADTQPNRAAEIKAQTAGEITEVLVTSGQKVARGDLLLRLSPGDRDAKLREAKALVAQRKVELEAAERLSTRGYQAAVQLEQSRAALEQAQALLVRIRKDIDYTELLAPWEGIVDRVHVDAGDYLGIGDPALTLVDNNPLSVVAHFPQDAVNALAVGQTATIALRSGEVRTGQVVEVAPRSKAATRTFRVEVQMSNPEGMAAGISADMRIVTGTVTAHRISPALLTLSAQGELGVKAVNSGGDVVFHAIDIVQTSPEAAWVTGLPDNVRLIVRGAGFVGVGERVRAQTLTTGEIQSIAAQSGTRG